MWRPLLSQHKWKGAEAHYLTASSEGPATNSGHRNPPRHIPRFERKTTFPSETRFAPLLAISRALVMLKIEENPGCCRSILACQFFRHGFFRRSSWLGGKCRVGVKFKRRGASQHEEPRPSRTLVTAIAIVELPMPSGVWGGYIYWSQGTGLGSPSSGWTLFFVTLWPRFGPRENICALARGKGIRGATRASIRSKLKNNILSTKYQCTGPWPGGPGFLVVRYTHHLLDRSMHTYKESGLRNRVFRCVRARW